MTDKIKIHTALICEDVRTEASGALSFMGLEPDGQFEVRKFPSLQRMAVLLVCDVLNVGELQIFAKLRYNGEPKWASEVELEIERPSTGVVIPLGTVVGSFDKPGMLELLVDLGADTGDGKHLIKQWPVHDVSATELGA